ncbi:recombination directionality factor SprB, partial [Bacillus siamensis]
DLDEFYKQFAQHLLEAALERSAE